ncbi:MAG: ABC transporter ATP-binding protein [Hyphomicrobiaceae bacterium]
MHRWFQWFETRIGAFPEDLPRRPPQSLGAFYWHYIKPVWPVFLVLLTVGCIGSLIEITLFAFIGSLVDLMRAAKTPETFFSDHGWLLGVMAFVALVMRPVVSTIHDLTKNQMISGPLTTRIRWLTHRYVLRQSLSFFQNDFAGRVANKVMQTGPALRESVVQVVDAIWYVAVYWTGAMVLFGQADIRLVLPLLGWLVAYGFAIVHFVPRIKRASAVASEARSMLMGRIVDSYTNILTVKLFAHADREDGYARGGLAEQMAKWQASLRLLTTLELVLYSMNGLLLVSVSALAIWLWSGGLITIGAIAVAMGLTIRIVNMSGWVLFTVAGIFENLGVVQEGMETISRSIAVVDIPDARDLVVDKGEIRFDHVTFNYGEHGDPAFASSRDGGPEFSQPRVVRDLSLVVRPGEKVGLVGRSGAGKSTLVNLLLRFYDLESGRILIDGQDIAGVTQDSLRAHIGMVTQDTSLLHRSVRHNILYGKPDAGDEAAALAARKAEAQDFIPGLADYKGRKGYDAHVGERGVKLSGGQRQRIAIARVLLKDAPILILDEATSALDSESESAIQEQLFNLMQGKTVIAIAHRLSTIAAMDRLVIMDKGQIVEQGSHAELIQRGGIYADLWAHQSGGFLLEEEVA